MGNANCPSVKRMRYSSNADLSAITHPKTDFMMLNHDCLLKLFEYLHLNDLSEIAEVNLMLKSLAAYYFRLKYRHFNCVSLIKDGLVPIEQVKKLLSNFGDQIVSFHMSRNIFIETKYIYSDLLSWAAQYCSENMKTLTLEEFKLKRKVMQTLIPFFQYIETMELIDCEFQSFSWEIAQNLKCLKLSQATIIRWKKLYKANLKQLETMEFNSLFCEDPSMIRFILSVPMLKRLSIVDCDVTTSIFWTIGQLQRLEEFEFRLNQINDSDENFQIDLQHLKKLKQLKVLQLDCEKRSVYRLLDGFVENCIAIEHLELAYGEIDDATIQSISKLTTIKSLKLNGMIGLIEPHIFQMTNGLQLLEEFCIKTRANISGFCIKRIVQRSSELASVKIDSPGFTLNDSTYKAMVASVQKCIKQTSLSFTIYSNGGRLLVSDDILQAPENAKWVSVRELDRDNNYMFPDDYTDTEDEDDDSDASDTDDMDDEDSDGDEDGDLYDDDEEDDVVDVDDDDFMWEDIESSDSDSNESSDPDSNESSDSDSNESSDSDSSESSDEDEDESSDSDL